MRDNRRIQQRPRVNRHAGLEAQIRHHLKKPSEIIGAHVHRNIHTHRDALDTMEHAGDTSYDNKLNPFARERVQNFFVGTHGNEAACCACGR